MDRNKTWSKFWSEPNLSEKRESWSDTSLYSYIIYFPMFPNWTTQILMYAPIKDCNLYILGTHTNLSVTFIGKRTFFGFSKFFTDKMVWICGQKSANLTWLILILSQEIYKSIVQCSFQNVCIRIDKPDLGRLSGVIRVTTLIRPYV